MRTRLLIRLFAAIGGCLLLASAVHAQDPPQTEPRPVLSELVLQNATVFTREDVLWLLRLEPGQRLPDTPDGIAGQLERRYHREGYTAARVSSSFDAPSGRLTLTVDEGRIDEVQVVGVPAEFAARLASQLADSGIRAGEIYNRRMVGRAVDTIIEDSEGALRIGRKGGEGPDDVDVVDRNGRRVLIVPLREQRARFSLTTGTPSREDLYNPVDGFAPGIGFTATAFDHLSKYTFVSGYLSQKFAAEHGGYSAGIERALMGSPRLVVGGEIHDITASDDMWRLSPLEQSLASVALKDTYRDYYRRHGWQLFGALRPTKTQEFLASWRQDRHDPLQNETNYSFFNDDDLFRPNAPTVSADLHALVLGYTFDSRRLTAGGAAAAYERHLVDDLYRGVRRTAFGWRVDWTSEIAGHGFGGDYTFDRHIGSARAYVPLSPRQSVAGRAMIGFSGGTLPPERQFALGGIGSVRGYDFKVVSGDRMQLFNAEYGIDLLGGRSERKVVRGLLFFDAGHTSSRVTGVDSDWLKGIGFGVQVWGIRVEWGYQLDDVPKSLRVLVRLSPTF